MLRDRIETDTTESEKTMRYKFASFVRAIAVAATGTAAAMTTTSAHANHHLMQIHQVIGGVDGETSAQAVQLRMRAAFQNLMQNGKLWAYDANGENPVLLIDFQDSVPNHGAGVTVLIASPDFGDFTDPAVQPDFVMTNLIPESYLDAGSLTFENNAGTAIWWRLSWGGDNYTGPTTGSATNDADGDFGVYPGVLPHDGVEALLFQGGATARSTNNADDYDLTAGAAVFTNNAGDDFTVVAPGGPVSVCPDDFTINRGLEVSGSFGDICGSDDAHWRWRPDALAATIVAPINLELNGTFDGGPPTSLTFAVEVAATDPGVVQRIELFNFATGQFEGAVFTNIPTTDTVHTVMRETGASDFVGPNGELRARVSYFRPAGVPPLWNILIDETLWTLVE